jgi:hypothetical protein
VPLAPVPLTPTSLTPAPLAPVPLTLTPLTPTPPGRAGAAVGMIMGRLRESPDLGHAGHLAYREI